MTVIKSGAGWLSGLRRGVMRTRENDIAPPQPERPLYAIGDIHGRVDLLDKLLERVDAHSDAQDLGTYDLVFLGDYVDRGPATSEVIERLRNMPSTEERTVTCLLGNHEDWLLGALDDGGRGLESWLRFGGRETLRSYGVSDVDEESPEAELRLCTEAREKIPKGVRSWLSNRPRQWQSGDVVAVHAFLDPELPVDSQDPNTLIWGRPSQFPKPRTDDIWFVHGHSVTRPAAVVGRRIAVDTGAYFSETLTAAVIRPGHPVSFLDTVNGLTPAQ